MVSLKIFQKKLEMKGRDLPVEPILRTDKTKIFELEQGLSMNSIHCGDYSDSCVVISSALLPLEFSYFILITELFPHRNHERKFKLKRKFKDTLKLQLKILKNNFISSRKKMQKVLNSPSCVCWIVSDL